MTTLITGASGFIGRRLLRPGERALVRRPSGFADEVVGDLLDEAALDRALRDVETVFHCAGLADADSREAAMLWRVNVTGTERLLAAAARAGVERFVFLSSVKAMAEPGNHCVDEDWPGEPVTAYGKSKRAAEETVLEAGARHGMHVVILRLPPVYGRGCGGKFARLAQAVRAGWFPRLGSAGGLRSLVHVEDVVEAMRLVAARPEANGKTYIVADPVPHSLGELIEAIRAVPPAPTFAWTLPGWAWRGAARLNPRMRSAIDRLLGSAMFSPTRIERELGWRARIGLEEGLREMLGSGTMAGRHDGSHSV